LIRADTCHTGSRVFEIQWSNQQGWFFAAESRPSTPQNYRINQEARGEFLRTYEAITLTPLPGSTLAQPSLYSSRCFFAFGKDCLYLTSSPDLSLPCVKTIATQPNPAIFDKLQFVAIQMDEFRIEQPSNPENELHIDNLSAFLSRMPELKSLSVVIADNRAKQESLGMTRGGPIEFSGLTCPFAPIHILPWLHLYKEILKECFPIDYKFRISLKKADRWGRLGSVDVWCNLTHKEIISLLEL
jgi:hypothetical protein